MPEKPLTFENALTRLEQIVDKMESGNLPLDQMVASFEEGRKLVEFCSGQLNEVERKIEMLVKGDNGGVKTVPFPRQQNQQ